jgi:hypothetical protein
VVDHGIGVYVARALDRVGQFRGYPKANRTDQGPEFTGKALDQWAWERGVALRLIQAGNGKFRDEYLNEHWFRARRGAGTDRRLASGLQPGPAAYCAGVPHAGGVRRCLPCSACRTRQAGSPELG